MSLAWYRFTSLFVLVILGVELAQAAEYRHRVHHYQHNHHFLHHHFYHGDYHHNYHNHQHCHHHHRISEKIQDKAMSYYRTVTVDPSGHGNFSTIQSAIDSVPSYNKYWFSICVKAGTYREKLKIPAEKPYIILKGEGKKKTIVKWNDHNGIVNSPTFLSSADNLVVKAISFVNSYNNPRNSNSMEPAVAAMISGDKSYFYHVGFYGLQDTLWDDQGRHYYKSCTIEGAMDFIFGTGQSLYEDCSISVIDGILGPGIRGFITAQGRTGSSDANGFVFKNCNISGNGTVYLGRPWRDYARVFFYNTKMSSVIEPLGWEAGKSIGREGRITFAEYGSYGAGWDMSKRVSWAKKLDATRANAWASVRFIDTDGWVKKHMLL